MNFRILVALLFGLTLLSAPQASFASEEQSSLTLQASSDEPLRKREVRLTAFLTPVPSEGEELTLHFERYQDSQWRLMESVLVDATGRASLPILTPDANRVSYRVRYDGDETRPAAIALIKLHPRKHRLHLEEKVPSTVKDERKARLRYRVTTRDGEALSGKSIELWRRLKGEKEATLVAKGKTDVRGRWVYEVSPRFDSWWRLKIPEGTYYRGKTTKARFIDNVPPGQPVSLPGPKPRIKLPAQPRATTPGANVRISPIPDKVWASMQGKSWRPGCASRSSLRYVRVNYWAFDGYRRQGQLVIAASAAGKYRKALEAIYRYRLPIRSMYLVDRFGYSSRLRGADDYKSMAADNTSAFNCRDVVGRPGVKSPHSSGRAFDINPWENPYASSGGWVPNSYWVGRSHPRVAWRSGAHRMVKTMRAAGFSWTYGTSDAHHFDA